MKSAVMDQLNAFISYAILGLMFAFATFSVVESWRANPLWIVTSVMFGVGCAFITEQLTGSAAFSYVVCAVGVITMPATISYFSGKPMLEVIDEIRDRLAKKDEDKK